MLTTIKRYYEKEKITLKGKPVIEEKTAILAQFLEKLILRPKSNEHPERSKEKYRCRTILMSHCTT